MPSYQNTETGSRGRRKKGGGTSHASTVFFHRKAEACVPKALGQQRAAEFTTTSFLPAVRGGGKGGVPCTQDGDLRPRPRKRRVCLHNPSPPKKKKKKKKKETREVGVPAFAPTGPIAPKTPIPDVNQNDCGSVAGIVGEGGKEPKVQRDTGKLPQLA